jgi:hypothetical protein
MFRKACVRCTTDFQKFHRWGCWRSFCKFLPFLILLLRSKKEIFLNIYPGLEPELEKEEIFLITAFPQIEYEGRQTKQWKYSMVHKKGKQSVNEKSSGNRILLYCISEARLSNICSHGFFACNSGTNGRHFCNGSSTIHSNQQKSLPLRDLKNADLNG